MKLEVIRFEFTEHSTIGALLVDDMFFAWTLEDATRAGPKIPGETCIPVGSYAVIIDWSDRFQRQMPHVLDVPDFTGIRFHNGATDKDTRGCILLGYSRGPDKIWDSKVAFSDFFEHISAAFYAGEAIYLTIREGAF